MLVALCLKEIAVFVFVMETFSLYSTAVSGLHVLLYVGHLTKQTVFNQIILNHRFPSSLQTMLSLSNVCYPADVLVSQ